jgi:hypothetical protein
LGLLRLHSYDADKILSPTSRNEDVLDDLKYLVRTVEPPANGGEGCVMQSAWVRGLFNKTLFVAEVVLLEA